MVPGNLRLDRDEHKRQARSKVAEIVLSDGDTAAKLPVAGDRNAPNALRVPFRLELQ